MNSPEWMTVAAENAEIGVAAGALVVAGLLGFFLTLLTLPGMWLALGVAMLVKLWQPDLLSWTTLGVVAAIACLGELIEFAASALGAAKGGATKRGAVGSMLGGFVGAVLGSPFLFPIGTVAGGVFGAGLGTVLVERGWVRRGWKDCARAGSGAAAGRLIATLVKGSCAGLIALILAIAAVF